MSVSAIGAYVITRLILISLGEPAFVLYDCVGFVIECSVLVAFNIVGLLLRRIVWVAILIAVVDLVDVFRYGFGPMHEFLPAFRQVLYSVVMPLLNAVLLLLCLRASGQLTPIPPQPIEAD